MGPTDGFNIQINPVNGAAKASDITIEGDTIEANHIAVALSAKEAGHHSNITLRKNTITGTGDAINAEYVDGLVILDNSVAANMASHLTECTNVVRIGNKLAGVPVGLENT
jgi:hypothetical protein